MDAMDAMAIVWMRGKCKWEDRMCTMCRCKGVVDVCIAQRLYTCDVLAQSPREKGPDKTEHTRESGKRPRQRAKHTAIYTHGTRPAASRGSPSPPPMTARRGVCALASAGRGRLLGLPENSAGAAQPGGRRSRVLALCAEGESVYPARWAGRAGRRCLDKLRFGSDERLLGVWVLCSLVCGFIRAFIEVRLFLYTCTLVYCTYTSYML